MSRSRSRGKQHTAGWRRRRFALSGRLEDAGDAAFAKALLSYDECRVWRSGLSRGAKVRYALARVRYALWHSLTRILDRLSTRYWRLWDEATEVFQQQMSAKYWEKQDAEAQLALEEARHDAEFDDAIARAL